MARVVRYVTGSRLRRDLRGAVVPPSDRQWHRAVGQVRQGAQEATARDPRALPLAAAQQRDRGHQQQDQGDRANGLSGPRLVRTQPARPTPPRNSLYENTLTLASPADRPVRAPARAVAFATATAIRGAGSSIAEPACRRPAPFPVSRAAPDRRPRLTAGKPTAGVAAHSHSLLRQPPPRVAARGRCLGSRCGRPPASSRLDTRPAPAPVNASPPPLRVAAHDSAAETPSPSFFAVRYKLLDGAAVGR